MNLLHTLTDFERRNGRALFATVFPTASEDGADVYFPFAWEDEPVEAFLDETFAVLPARPALGLRAALVLIALAPLFVIRRFATLASLPRADRERVLVVLAGSEVYVIRQLVLAWKAVGGLYFGGLDAVRSKTLLPPPDSFGRKLPVLREAPHAR